HECARQQQYKLLQCNIRASHCRAARREQHAEPGRTPDAVRLPRDVLTLAVRGFAIREVATIDAGDESSSPAFLFVASSSQLPASSSESTRAEELRVISAHPAFAPASPERGLAEAAGAA